MKIRRVIAIYPKVPAKTYYMHLQFDWYNWSSPTVIIAQARQILRDAKHGFQFYQNIRVCYHLRIFKFTFLTDPKMILKCTGTLSVFR